MNEMPREIWVTSAYGGRRGKEKYYNDEVRYVRADAEDPRKCPMSDKCDLAIAYLKGVEDGKNAVRKAADRLAEVLDMCLKHFPLVGRFADSAEDALKAWRGEQK